MLYYKWGFCKSPNSRPHNRKQCPSKARNWHTREVLQYFSDMWCKKNCLEWMLQSKFLFWMKNLSNSIEWCQNLRYTSTSLSNIYSMWGIVRLGDWTEAVNWNSNTAVLAQHIYSKARVISKCDLMHTVQRMVIPNKTAYSSSYQYTVYLTGANSIRSQTSNSCSVTTPSAMSLSEYFFSTCSCRRICLYISGWVNMGSSISLWPNRL